MELTGLHSDIVEAGSFIQIRDANIPVAWCANLPRSSRSCQSTASSGKESFLATINIGKLKCPMADHFGAINALK
jgi:hypothetical protein